MKRIVYYMVLMVAAATLNSCLKDMKDAELFGGNKEVEISIDLPEALASESKADFKVRLRNISTGSVYVTETDEQGVASIDAEYGSYNLIVNKEIEVDGVIKFLTATKELVLSKNDQSVESLVLDIKSANKGTIILKETYFHKTKAPDGKANYNLDQYFTLYNNSDKIQYLDGIGLGLHQDFNSSGTANFTKAGSTELRDSVPVNAFGLMFPGKGEEYPLQPGQEVVIALSAINHTATVTDRPINLTGDNVWAMWIQRFKETPNQKPPQAGVKKLLEFCDYALGTVIVLSVSSPAIVIFRIEGDASEYVKEGPIAGRPGGNVMFKPTAYKSLPSIMIPKEWVYDGVEYRTIDSHVSRLCSEVSLQPLLISSKANTGISYIRKVDQTATAAAGHTVYQDTNNSSDDWMMIDRPTLSTK